MKKYLITFGLLISVALGAVKYFAADETPPSGLSNVQNTLYQTADKQLWLNKGPQYGWNRIARYSDLAGASGSVTATPNSVHKNDANGNLNWANKIITSNGNQIDRDSDTGTWYWNHVVSGSASSEPVTVVTDVSGNTTVTSNGGTIL